MVMRYQITQLIVQAFIEQPHVFTVKTCPGGSLESSISKDHKEQAPVSTVIHGCRCQLFSYPRWNFSPPCSTGPLAQSRTCFHCTKESGPAQRD